MCDNYCKYTDHGMLNELTLRDVCSKCPLNELSEDYFGDKVTAVLNHLDEIKLELDFLEDEISKLSMTKSADDARIRSVEFYGKGGIIPDDDTPTPACMKENGIKAFTYSCQATDAIETLWLFKQAGCTIGEMVEVNLRKDSFDKGYEKGHAFKMKF